MRNAFAAPELAAGPRERLASALVRARVVVGPAAIVAALVVPGLSGSERVALAGAVSGFYLPVVAWSLLRRRPHRGLAGRLADVGGDIVAIFLVTLVEPDVQVIALTGYTVFVVYFTVVYGRAVGMPLAAAAAAFAVTAAAVRPAPTHPDAYTLTMFAIGLGVLVAILDTATLERRRASRFLVRLQHAIRQVPFLPGLEETLDAISAVAQEAVDAKFVSVLVRDGDHLVQGALHGDLAGRAGIDSKERAQEVIQRIRSDPDGSPSGRALHRGETVIVEEVGADPRFSHWTDEAARQEFTSTIAVPLRTGEDVVGVIAAYLPHPSLVTRDRIDLLQAYAEHVTLVILRALAHEHERRAAEQLSDAARLKSDLVATVSHELRTPLTSIRGFLDTVLRYWDRLDDGERLHMLERVDRNADVLSELVDQVLDYSRMEAGGVRVELAEQELAPLLAHLFDTWAPLVAEHDLQVDVPPGLRGVVDTSALDHVLSNLVGNAVRYAEPGTTVAVEARQEGGEVRISVSDEGPGIPESELRRIFERFQRGTGAAGHRGTGLGLAIAQGYVEMMGGRLWVDSEVGKGSTFSFTVPAAPAGGDGPRSSGRSPGAPAAEAPLDTASEPEDAHRA